MNTTNPPSAPVIADRACGVVLASAAGDALGAGYEFGPPLPPLTPVGMDGGGAFGWEPGEWTDDTQMALAILSVLADGEADLARIESNFRAWYDSDPADVGNQTRRVLDVPGPLAERAASYTAAHPTNAAGNGSLMRTGPVALAHPRHPAAIATLATSVSELTHPDVDCVAACVLWSVAIDHTVHHAPASGVAWDWVSAFEPGLQQLDADTRRRWRTLIEEATRSTALDFPNNGWVVHAFQAALAAITSTPVPDGVTAGSHLRLSLDEVVRAGGDTDTVAAIAGALLGARWGATAIPLRWRRRIHGRRTYAEPAIRAADLERLARVAAVGGRPDLDGWPVVESMIPTYAAEWSIPAHRVRIDGVAFGNVSALEAALADGVDTVVSLCRMGNAEVGLGVEHHALGLIDSTPDDNPNAVLLIADIADQVQRFVDEGRRVFVHCVHAQHRTPTVAAAWLHRHCGLTADEALDRAAAELNRPRGFLSDAVRQLHQIPFGTTDESETS